MSRGLGQLTLDLAIKIGGFTAGLDKAGRELDKRTRQMQKNATAFGKVIGASLVAGITAFGFAVNAAIDQADQLNEISQKIGIPTDVLSGLNYAAKLAGVATEELQAGLVKMVKFQADAAKGGKESVKVFSTLGIAIKDASGNLRASDDVFRDFAEVFKGLQDGPEKTALALRVFGKAGAELIPLLNEGKAGLAGYAKELADLGGVVTPATAKAADEFNDNIDKLKVAFGGLALSVAKELLPALRDLSSQLVDFAKDGGNASTIASFIGNEFTGTARAIRATSFELDELKKAWNEQGFFGEGILSVLDRANTKFEEAEAHRANLMRTGLDQGRTGIRGGRGMGADRPKDGNVRGGIDLSPLFSPGAPKAAKATKDAVDQVAEAFKRMNEQMAEQIALYGQTSEVAKVRYDLEHGELAKLSDEKKAQLLDQAATLDQLAKEKELLDERNKAEEERLKVQQQAHESVADLLSDMQFELDILGKTNAQRIAEIELRRIGIGLTAEEAAAAKQAIEVKATALEQQHQLVDAMDDFRATFEDSVVDVVTGAKSIGDAFKSMADQLIAQITRIIAQQWTEKLFGGMGTTGGGSSGNWLGQIFGSLIGGNKFAGGTDFAPGGMSLVGERGPEIVNLPRGASVTPNHKMGGANIVINIAGNATRETAQYTANKVAQKLAFSRRG